MESREHKYRVWDRPSKKHFYENENTRIDLYGNGEWDFCEKEGWTDLVCGHVWYSKSDHMNGTIQQWTGIKDINKNDIYEGDIITFGGEWDENGLVVRNPTVNYYEVVWLWGGFHASQLGLNFNSDGRGFKFVGHTDSEVVGHTLEDKWDEYKNKVIV